MDDKIGQRAYTVGVIDALRRVVGHKWMWGTYNSYPSPIPRIGRSFREEERIRCVEEMVRTHMLAGQTAEDLLASEPAPVMPTPEEWRRMEEEYRQDMRP